MSEGGRAALFWLLVLAGVLLTFAQLHGWAAFAWLCAVAWMFVEAIRGGGGGGPAPPDSRGP